MGVIATNRVVICGGGFGGVAAARRLRELLAEDDEIVLIDRGTHFAMGFRKTSEVIGREPMAAGSRPLSALERFGIRVVQAEITGIDPSARVVEASGDRYEADAILVALGADTVPGAIPGLTEHGIDWYSSAHVPRAAEAVASIERGRIVIAIFGAPYKCPPAPFELALLLNDALRARGTKGVELEVLTPLPLSIPVIGQAGCDAIEGRLAGMMIGLRREAKAERVEAGKVVLAGGDEVPFDVLLAVPPHRVPPVVVAAGLAPEGGWIKPDPRTLRTPVENVWAVGDCGAIPMATGQPLPKAGGFAEAEGLVAAAHIAASLRGTDAAVAFEGEGACFLEVGDGEAMMVRGRFLAQPAPDVELTRPSAEFLEEKNRFERERLDAWFGPA